MGCWGVFLAGWGVLSTIARLQVSAGECWLRGCLQDVMDPQTQAATPGESGGSFKTRAQENLNRRPPVMSRTRNTGSGPLCNVQRVLPRHPGEKGGHPFK
jgi:hypothetical protein